MTAKPKKTPLEFAVEINEVIGNRETGWLEKVEQLIKERDRLPDRDEVQFVCDFNSRLPVNGWEVGRIGQNLGQQFRSARQPGWTVLRGRVTLSVWLKKDESGGAS